MVIIMIKKKSKTIVALSIVLSFWYLLSYITVYLPQLMGNIESETLVKILNVIDIFFVTGILGDGAIGFYLLVPVIFAVIAVVGYFIMKDLNKLQRDIYLILPVAAGAFGIIAMILSNLFMSIAAKVAVPGLIIAWIVYCIYILRTNKKYDTTTETVSGKTDNP